MTIIMITMKNNYSFYVEKDIKSFWILMTSCWKLHTIESAMEDLITKTSENGNGI